MTAEIRRKQSRINRLEAELTAVNGKEPRIDLLDQALSFYVYTNPERAKDLLEEQDGLLHKFDLPDTRLTYFIHLATYCNQQYQFIDAESAILSALEMVEEYGSVSQKIDLLIDYSGNLLNQEKLDGAESYLEQAVRLLENFPDKELKARADCRYGALFLRKRLYPKALQHYLQALTAIGNERLSLSLKGHYFYTLVNTGLGNVYERTGYYDKAVEAYERTIERCEALGLKGRLAWHYLNLGNAYWYNGEIAKAATYFDRVIDNDTDDSVKARAAALANLGSIYIDEGAFEQAENLIGRAEELYQQVDKADYANSSAMAIFRANIKEGLGEHSAAIAQLEKAVGLAEKAGESQLLAEGYFELGRLYAQSGDFKAAYLAQCEYDHHQQNYRKELNAQQQRELEAKFESEAREKESERLKLKAAQLQLRALRAQMNPHFLYNCLNSIQSFITSNRASSASKYLSQFALLMRQSLEYTNLEFISLEDEVDFLNTYLEINCHLRFEGQLDFDISIDEELEEDILGVPTMIIQPYVENAIEHGLRGRKSGQIIVTFDVVDESTILATITDNGIGRQRVAEIQAKDPSRAEHRSRGTEITLSRLRLLTKIEADNQANGLKEPVMITDLYTAEGDAAGTKVEVHIPVVDMQLGRFL